MAIYTSIDELAKRLDPAILAGLADDTNTPPDINDSATQVVLNQAISDGASLIDSYLVGRLDLGDPLVQASLERANATLALYMLYRRRYVDDALNPLAAAREAICAHLAAVCRGEEHIGLGDTGDAEPEQCAYSNTEEQERSLDWDALQGF